MTWDWMLRPLPQLDEERRPRWRPLDEWLGSLAPDSSDEGEREEGAHDEDGDEAHGSGSSRVEGLPPTPACTVS
jgi:hypothetical protein